MKHWTKKAVNQVAYDVVGLAIEVHKGLGPGLLESVYETCLHHELVSHGFKVTKQQVVLIQYKAVQLNAELRLDLLVNDILVVELKTVEALHPVFEAQLLTYMKLLKKPKGLLINFFTDNITESLKPLVNEYFAMLPDE